MNPLPDDPGPRKPRRPWLYWLACRYAVWARGWRVAADEAFGALSDHADALARRFGPPRLPRHLSAASQAMLDAWRIS